LRETREELAGAGWLGLDLTINVCNGSPVALWWRPEARERVVTMDWADVVRIARPSSSIQRLAVRWAGVKRSHGENTQRRAAVAAAGQAGRATGQTGPKAWQGRGQAGRAWDRLKLEQDLGAPLMVPKTLYHPKTTAH
jgi:hypothetical protein